jgi:hypothetical protein
MHHKTLFWIMLFLLTLGLTLIVHGFMSPQNILIASLICNQ